jgi:hypothetical protein
MSFRERVLYHQIHALKLLTDWSAGFAAAYLLWQHRLAAGLLLGLIPPIVISILLMRWADLEPLKASPFGRYVSRYMTRGMELLRLGALSCCGSAPGTTSRSCSSVGSESFSLPGPVESFGRGCRQILPADHREGD